MFILVIIIARYDRFSSIPDAYYKLLEDTECFCRPSLDIKEVLPMDKKNEKFAYKVTNWLSRFSFYIVVGLSIFHIGLAYIHTRESGKADHIFIL